MKENNLAQKVNEEERSSTDGYNEYYAWLDQLFYQSIGKLTFSLSPASITLAFCDWIIHLASSPGKQVALSAQALELLKRYQCVLRGDQEDKKCQYYLTDKRFKDPAWQKTPYKYYQQAFLYVEDWWKNAACAPGTSEHHSDVIDFTLRQMLNFFSPTNFPFTNPEVLSATIEQMGMNLFRGYKYFLEDLSKPFLGEPPESLQKFKAGRDVAITPGKVIYRNNLIELIQYSPSTKEVYAEPILFVPAWIMKYYILDLSPQNSLVKYMVDKGHTVFMISWKNPTQEDRDLSFEDYIQLGIMDALKVIKDICPKTSIHAAGYCLGGTLLTMAAAYLSRYNHQQLKTVTLFAAQTDFTEAGEILLFVDESQINFLKKIMKQQGYLDKPQLKGTFQMLKSTDLIWSYMLRNYLLGIRKEPSDLMAWNADETRLPYRMHMQYLKNIYLKNDLAEGRFKVNQKPIAIQDVAVPIFCVATVKDHISPWQSVHKVHLLADTDVTFVLTSGGHNVGIVSNPDHPKAAYQIKTTPRNEVYLSPDRWESIAPHKKGSWWLAWQEWIAQASSTKKVMARPAGNKNYKALENSPGTYIYQT